VHFAAADDERLAIEEEVLVADGEGVRGRGVLSGHGVEQQECGEGAFKKGEHWGGVGLRDETASFGAKSGTGKFLQALARAAREFSKPCRRSNRWRTIGRHPC
jgi:hypothetical protein